MKSVRSKPSAGAHRPRGSLAPAPRRRATRRRGHAGAARRRMVVAAALELLGMENERLGGEGCSAVIATHAARPAPKALKTIVPEHDRPAGRLVAGKAEGVARVVRRVVERARPGKACGERSRPMPKTSAASAGTHGAIGTRWRGSLRGEVESRSHLLLPSHRRSGFHGCAGRSPGSRVEAGPRAFPVSQWQSARAARRLQLRGQLRIRG